MSEGLDFSFSEGVEQHQKRRQGKAAHLFHMAHFNFDYCPEQQQHRDFGHCRQYKELGIFQRVIYSKKRPTFFARLLVSRLKSIYSLLFFASSLLQLVLSNFSRMSVFF